MFLGSAEILRPVRWCCFYGSRIREQTGGGPEFADSPFDGERKGGSAAVDRVIDYIRTKPFGNSNRVALTCNKDNLIARKLYEHKGFAATGVEDDDEIELALML